MAQIASKCGLTFALCRLVCYMSPNQPKYIEAAILHCSETFISELIVTHVSFSFTVVPRTVYPISWFTSEFPCPLFKHLHFPKLNNICHFSDLLINLSTSFRKCCLSSSLLTLLNTFVTSANFSTLLFYIIVHIIDIYIYIYIKNN